MVYLILCLKTLKTLFNVKISLNSLCRKFLENEIFRVVKKVEVKIFRKILYLLSQKKHLFASKKLHHWYALKGRSKNFHVTKIMRKNLSGSFRNVLSFSFFQENTLKSGSMGIRLSLVLSGLNLGVIGAKWIFVGWCLFELWKAKRSHLIG